MAMLPPPPPGSAPSPPLASPADRSRPRPRRSLLVVVLAAAVVWMAALAGAVVGGQVTKWLDRPPTRPSDQPLRVADPSDLGEKRINVAEVAEYVAPSVVTVSADMAGGSALGTGMIISSDGEVLTNAHVVEGATAVRVRLAGESEPRKATLLATDPGNDLALLRLDGDGFAPVTFADPDSVRIGDEVVAIGFAIGLDGDPSVTLGIVSALDRSFSTDDAFLNGLIQTDASISSGNSGGPLVNAEGNVVGVNTAVARDAPNVAVTNVSFAISAEEALSVIEALRAGAGGAERTEAYLGVGLGDRIDGGQGAVVTEVQPGTPAAEVGLEVGDLVVAVDDQVTAGSAGLIAAIRDLEPGTEVELTVVRDGAERVVTTTLVARPDG
jgi:putative serine protease PepD